MKIVIPVELPQGKVWPFKSHTVSFLYCPVESNTYEVIFPWFSTDLKRLGCLRLNIDPAIREYMTRTVLKFVTIAGPDIKGFDEVVSKLDPLFAEYPAFMISHSGITYSGQVEFKITHQEVSS